MQNNDMQNLFALLLKTLLAKTLLNKILLYVDIKSWYEMAKMC